MDSVNIAKSDNFHPSEDGMTCVMNFEDGRSILEEEETFLDLVLNDYECHMSEAKDEDDDSFELTLKSKLRIENGNWYVMYVFIWSFIAGWINAIQNELLEDDFENASMCQPVDIN